MSHTLRQAGYSLAVTEESERSVWVADGLGDDYDGLSPTEREERQSSGSATVG